MTDPVCFIYTIRTRRNVGTRHRMLPKLRLQPADSTCMYVNISSRGIPFNTYAAKTQRWKRTTADRQTHTVYRTIPYDVQCCWTNTARMRIWRLRQRADIFNNFEARYIYITSKLVICRQWKLSYTQADKFAAVSLTMKSQSRCSLSERGMVTQRSRWPCWFAKSNGPVSLCCSVNILHAEGRVEQIVKGHLIPHRRGGGQRTTEREGNPQIISRAVAARLAARDGHLESFMNRARRR